MCKGFSCWDPLGSEILEPFWGEFRRVAMLDSLRMGGIFGLLATRIVVCLMECIGVWSNSGGATLGIFDESFGLMRSHSKVVSGYFWPSESELG